MMRKVLISLAAAGAALAAATPAAAQYYPQAQRYGYTYNSRGEVRALQARIDAIQNQIRRLDRRDLIRDGAADRLRADSRNIERQLHRAARYGLSPYEAAGIRNRIGRLEQRVQWAMNGRYGRYGHSASYRDHDGWGQDRD